jgi:hypothetical protein
MNISIHSLIQMLGLDPSLADTSEHAGEQADDEEDSAEGTSTEPRRKNSAIDYDSFFSTWGGAGGRAGGGEGAIGHDGSGAGGHVKRSPSDLVSSSTPSGTSVAGLGRMLGL